MRSRINILASCIISLGASVGCRQEMYDQARAKPLSRSDFFDDDVSVRAPVEGTVSRDESGLDEVFLTGKTGNDYAEAFPFEVRRDDMRRGRVQFDIFCASCHDRTGQGDGMIVRHGFKHPPTLMDPRLRKSPPGYFFDVMTNGFGSMYGLADRISPRDRWRIAAYVRALQLSQSATLAGLPNDIQARFREGEWRP